MDADLIEYRIVRADAATAGRLVPVYVLQNGEFKLMARAVVEADDIRRIVAQPLADRTTAIYAVTASGELREAAPAGEQSVQFDGKLTLWGRWLTASAREKAAALIALILGLVALLTFIL